MNGVIRVSPLWGGGFVAYMLALIGVAPFALFLSKFMIVKAAIDTGSYWTAAVLLTGVAVVFVGTLRQVISMAWGAPNVPVTGGGTYAIEKVLIFAPLVALLALGVWMPPTLLNMLKQAATLLGGGL